MLKDPTRTLQTSDGGSMRITANCGLFKIQSPCGGKKDEKDFYFFNYFWNFAKKI